MAFYEPVSGQPHPYNKFLCPIPNNRGNNNNNNFFFTASLPQSQVKAPPNSTGTQQPEYVYTVNVHDIRTVYAKCEMYMWYVYVSQLAGREFRVTCHPNFRAVFIALKKPEQKAQVRRQTRGNSVDCFGQCQPCGRYGQARRLTFLVVRDL